VTLADRELRTPDRVFGEHEATAMFTSIDNALALVGSKHCGEFLAELRAERDILIAHRKALANLLAATKSENFSRVTKREMTQWLRSAIKQAEEALNG
jgi:hypothetical protein